MRRIAVADIGSNSARMIVVQRSGDHGLIPLAESKVTLRLQRELSQSPETTPGIIERIISVVRDFSAVARSSEADKLITVATSAIRNFPGSTQIVSNVLDATGVEIRILSGEEEAELTFKGVMANLSSHSGMIIDIGGGSMETVRFDDRKPTLTRTLPLGALKVSDEFLKSGSVAEGELESVHEHVIDVLASSGIDTLAPGAVAVGSGGTVRNAGKIDRRRRSKKYARLHGHRLSQVDLRATLDQLASLSLRQLEQVPGLNPERADSIIGGLAVLVSALEFLGCDSIQISGSGLREGLALEAFEASSPDYSGSPEQSVRDMCARFSTWDADRAKRRSEVARAICDGFADKVSDEIAEAVSLASELVDAGSTIDYYRRYENAALLIENSNAGSLTHRQIALIAAVCKAADRNGIKASDYGGEVASDEVKTLRKAGFLLRLADEVEMRLPRGHRHSVKLDRPKRGEVGLRVMFPGGANLMMRSLRNRYASLFGRELELTDYVP